MTHILLIVFLLCLGLYLVRQSNLRSSHDVLRDLESSDKIGTITDAKDRLILDSEFANCGVFKESEILKLKVGRKIVPIGFGLGFLMIQPLISSLALKNSLIFLMIGMLFGYLFYNSYLRKKAKAYQSSIEYYVPLVIERLIIAVQAGRDIYAAISSITTLDDELNGSSKKDPVSELLLIAVRLTESGFSLEKALSEVSSKIDVSSLRHALVHLSLAYKEGGEVAMPLRELGDATQLQYQEMIEEYVAKLPATAVLPLICTFAGLIICFITSPLIKVMGITLKASMP